MSRPFLIRRLGHIGLNLAAVDQNIRFYRDHLGLMVSDQVDMRDILPASALDGVDETHIYFLRYCSDHHAMVMASVPMVERLSNLFGPIAVGTTVNQISWQVGSLEEVVLGGDWIAEQGVQMVRSGRDMPGSNWHSYFADPEGVVAEIFYGMEQIGWDGLSKPVSQYRFGLLERPTLPVQCEAAEVTLLAERQELASGYRSVSTSIASYSVQGVLMPRPFKVITLGPIKLFCADLEAALHFHRDIMGLRETDRVSVFDHEVIFLRATSNHHDVVLLPEALRRPLDVEGRDKLLSLGFRVANYRQLKDARSYFGALGYREQKMPSELSLGVDRCFHLIDPDGRLIQLYCAIEQIGWDQKARQGADRLFPSDDWPENVDALPDMMMGQQFHGPWH